MKSRCPEPNKPGCPYMERGCYADTDHIVPQRIARSKSASAITRIYILDHPENRQQLCRWEHDEKTLEGDEPLPSQEYMQGAITEAYEAGEMYLSSNKLRRLGMQALKEAS